MPSSSSSSSFSGTSSSESSVTYAHSIVLRIDNTKIDSDQYNFPVLVYLSASSGIANTDVTQVFDELGENRKKFKIEDSNGDQCYVEIERWLDHDILDSNSESSSSSQDGRQAWLWVRVPFVSSSSVTLLTMYYDSTAPDNDAYVGDIGSTVAQSVWTHDLAVWHMDNQDPVTDSVNGYSLSHVNSPVYSGSASPLAGSYLFDGSNQEELQRATSTTPDCAPEVTAAAWVYLPETPDGTTRIVQRWEGSGGSSQFLCALNDSGSPYLHPFFAVYAVNPGNNFRIRTFTTLTAPIGEWFFVAYRRGLDGHMKAWINTDSEDIDDGVTADMDSPNIITQIYDYQSGTTNTNTAYIDEIRVTDEALSDAYISGQYYSQADSLITFDVEESSSSQSVVIESSSSSEGYSSSSSSELYSSSSSSELYSSSSSSSELYSSSSSSELYSSSSSSSSSSELYSSSSSSRLYSSSSSSFLSQSSSSSSSELYSSSSSSEFYSSSSSSSELYSSSSSSEFYSSSSSSSELYSSSSSSSSELYSSSSSSSELYSSSSSSEFYSSSSSSSELYSSSSSSEFYSSSSSSSNLYSSSSSSSELYSSSSSSSSSSELYSSSSSSELYSSSSSSSELYSSSSSSEEYSSSSSSSPGPIEDSSSSSSIDSSSSSSSSIDSSSSSSSSIDSSSSSSSSCACSSSSSSSNGYSSSSSSSGAYSSSSSSSSSSEFYSSSSSSSVGYSSSSSSELYSSSSSTSEQYSSSSSSSSSIDSSSSSSSIDSSSSSSSSSSYLDYSDSRIIPFIIEQENTPSIWCLGLYNQYAFAGSGPNGMVLRSHDRAFWEDYYKTSDAHVTAVYAHDDNLYIGTSPLGYVYISNLSTGVTSLSQELGYGVVDFVYFMDALYAATDKDSTIYKYDFLNTKWDVFYEPQYNIHRMKKIGDKLYLFVEGPNVVSFDGDNWVLETDGVDNVYSNRRVSKEPYAYEKQSYLNRSEINTVENPETEDQIEDTVEYIDVYEAGFVYRDLFVGLQALGYRVVSYTAWAEANNSGDGGGGSRFLSITTNKRDFLVINYNRFDDFDEFTYQQAIAAGKAIDTTGQNYYVQKRETASLVNAQKELQNFNNENIVDIHPHNKSTGIMCGDGDGETVIMGSSNYGRIYSLIDENIEESSS